MADVERRLEHADARGAEPLAARALAIWRATVGEEHFETIAASVLLGRARADLGHDAEPLLRAALAYFDTHPARATAVGDAAFALARALSRKTPRSSAETAETAEIDALLARARARYRAGGSKARATALDTWENSHGR